MNWRHSFFLLALLAGCDGEMPDTDAGDDPDSGAPPMEDAGRDAGMDAGPGPAPTFRNADLRPDEQVARDALRSLGLPMFGGNPARCVACHDLSTAGAIRAWADPSAAAWTNCFSNLAPATRAESAAIIECFRNDAGEYDAAELGIYASGAHFDWFAWIFRTGGPADFETELETFRDTAGMPPASHPALTQGEFDTLTEWFQRGLPMLDELFMPVDPPGTCTDYTTAAVDAVLDASELDSWSTRNAGAGMLMYGCAGAATPRDCFSTLPRVSTIDGAADWETPAGTLRVVYNIPYQTSYWTRSSANGRWVAHGGSNTGAGASIIDLERGVVVGVNASYDPGFFPDGSGFVFQPGQHVCHTNVLLASPTRINFAESGCISASFGLYEHVGASLDGDDYWIVESPATWTIDDGSSLEDPSGIVASASTDVLFHRLTNTGSGFVAGADIRVVTPYLTNHVLSPTGRLMVTQLSNGGRNIGYALHRVDITRDGSGVPTSIALPEIGRYCQLGGKPAMSLDDRWLITHHRADDSDAVDLGFTGPGDPAFAAYRGISNVYLVDLRTGARTRLTNMQPGQAALFPHFRSDGWIYILIRTGNGSGPEYIVASDAALAP